MVRQWLVPEPSNLVHYVFLVSGLETPRQVRPGADEVAWHLSLPWPFHIFSTAGLLQGRQTLCVEIRAPGSVSGEQEPD